MFGELKKLLPGILLCDVRRRHFGPLTGLVQVITQVDGHSAVDVVVVVVAVLVWLFCSSFGLSLIYLTLELKPVVVEEITRNINLFHID